MIRARSPPLLRGLIRWIEGVTQLELMRLCTHKAINNSNVTQALSGTGAAHCTGRCLH